MGAGLEVAGACRGKCDADRAANRGVRDLVAEVERARVPRAGALGHVCILFIVYNDSTVKNDYYIILLLTFRFCMY